MSNFHRCAVAILAVGSGCIAAELAAIADWQRIDDRGRLLDVKNATSPPSTSTVSLEGARGGYVSVQLVAMARSPGDYSLNIDPFPADSGIECDLYREWFHYVPAAKNYYPDALVPLRFPHSASLPDADNRISGQSAQPFWLDIWIPADARPGEYGATVRMQRNPRV